MWEDFFFAFFKVFQPSNGAFDLFFSFFDGVRSWPPVLLFCFRRCAEQAAGPLTLICEVIFFSGARSWTRKKMTECSDSFALPGDFAGLPVRGIAQAH